MIPVPTRSISSRKPTTRTIYVPCPLIGRDRQRRVSREESGAPRFYRPGMRPAGWEFTIGLRNLFVDLCATMNSDLTKADLCLLLHLVRSCGYVAASVFYDDDTGEPIRHPENSSLALAAIRQKGNVTAHFTYARLERRIETSDRTVRKSVRRLIQLGFIKPIPNDPSYEAKYRRRAAKRRPKGGAPEELMRFEIHPDVAWNGPVGEGKAYADQVRDEWPPFELWTSDKAFEDEDDKGSNKDEC